MSEVFQAVKITEDVYWVGAIDWALREFHGYRTSRGSTYNAFLILGERITLVDTVKEPFYDEMMARIRSIVDPEKIEIIVSNHAEMDHSGCLPQVIEAVKPRTILASSKGVEALKAHFHWPVEVQAVQEGGSFELSGPDSPSGPLNLHFMETRMLHWPDSMFSYLKERKLLFSQDGFGMHLASFERFDDELPRTLLEEEASKYFANILLPFAPMILKTLEKVQCLNLDIAMVAPDHGPIWRQDFPWIVERYQAWSQQKTQPRAVIFYDTMWESTQLMARAIGEGVHSAGATAKLLPLSGTHRSDLATEILDAGALVVGSPTINGQIYPTLAEALVYLKGLKPKNRIGATFGSHGWGGEGVRHLDQYLADMGIENLGSVKTSYVPLPDVLQACWGLGQRIGERLSGKA